MRLALATLVVRDYDEAIRFFCEVLDFELVEDVPDAERNKRWVVVRPSGGGTGLVLGRPSAPEQEAFVGDQTGGRVTFFLATDDFERDHAKLKGRGVGFVRPPTDHVYGRVAVFEDLYGNRWDLVQYASGHVMEAS